MTIAVYRFVALVLLIGSVGLAKNSNQTNSQSGDPQMQSSSGEQDLCFQPKEEFGFALKLALPHTSGKLNLYDVDGKPPGQGHRPICLDEGKDVILWYPSQSKQFSFEISYKSGGQQKCGTQPFEDSPPSGDVVGYYSGTPRVGTRGCDYDVKFKTHGQQPADPHIHIGP